MNQENNIVTRLGLCQRIEQLPQVDIGHYPTPLEPCPRLSEALGGPRIYIKREDCSGVAFGGNKIRQLTFTIGEAIHQNADTIVHGATTQSNHCRQAAAVAAQLGLNATFVFLVTTRVWHKGIYFWIIWLVRTSNWSMHHSALNWISLNML